MADSDRDFLRLLSDVEKFFQVQKDLYGDSFFRAMPAPSTTPVAAPPTANMKKKVPSIDAHQTVQSSDLFGNSPPLSTPRVAEALPAYSQEPWTSAQSIDVLNALICNCLKCGLGHTRKKFVFGVGNPKADVVVIGEAPGADEDEQGEPFVGRAGQLLNKILEAVQFKREEVFICNILKCRPPENRKPSQEEIELCEPYLWKQLELIKPKMILCLGLTAGQSLLKTNSSLTALRGRFHDYRGLKLMVTYHPAALLRNPNWKRPAWEDVQLFRKTYDQMRITQ